MQSVFYQTFKDYEYIIIDGGSIDGSTKYIERFAGRISYWISEKDSGLYHAMNKGIMRAKGEYLVFLNSGDVFYSKDSIENLIKENIEDIIYGNIIVRTNEGSYLKSYPSKLTFQYFLEDTLPHPGTLIKASLFKKNGLYNEYNKIVSDWEFFLNSICLYRASYKYVNLPAAIFTFNGVSSIPENKIIIKEEKDAILQKYYKAFLPDYKKANQYKEIIEKFQSANTEKPRKRSVFSILFLLIKKVKVKS